MKTAAFQADRLAQETELETLRHAHGALEAALGEARANMADMAAALHVAQSQARELLQLTGRPVRR